MNFFRNYSIEYFTSIFLFVASADYISWMMNGIRQFTAVTIVLLAAHYIINKKFFTSILIIAIAATIHQTALLMIPIIFIVQGDAWNKKTVIYIVLTIIAVIFVIHFTDLLDDVLAGTQYENVIEDMEEYGNVGTNFLRVAVYSVPAIAAFFFRKKINNEGNTIIKISANMSIVSSGLYIVSMVTSGVYIGRLPIYCSLYGYLLIPWLIKKIFEEKYRFIIYSFMIGFYLIYYYFQVSVQWQLF